MMNVEFAEKLDMDSWMELLDTVKKYFPGLDISQYRAGLQKSVDNKEALAVKMEDKIIGALAFSKSSKELTFLAVHPDYRKMGIGRILVQKMVSLFPIGTKLTVITYCENDVQGTAARAFYHSMGFECGRLLTVFDYPCQELIYIVK